MVMRVSVQECAFVSATSGCLANGALVSAHHDTIVGIVVEGPSAY